MNTRSTMVPNHRALTVLLVLTLSGPCLSTFTEEVTDFNRQLQHIRDDVIGVPVMQDMIDSITFNESPVDGNGRISQLADYISSGFGERFEAIRRIRDITISLYENGSIHDPEANLQYCCNLNPEDLEYDPDYGLKIAQELCLRSSSNAPPDAVIPNSAQILEVFRDNADRLPGLKWQYFGTEQGVTLTYPARPDIVGCGVYDPRFRPWYAEVATTIPKDVVIVMDRSESMETNNRLSISQEAAKTVVDTLNPNDKVGLVLFSSDITQPEGNGENCYQSELAYATPYVRDFLKHYIDDITVKDNTQYIPALEAAFDYFTVDNSRRMVILFLTDGQPRETMSSILSRLSQLNAEKQNKVLILTYGLDYDDADGLLKDMAEMKEHDPSAGPVTKGEFTHITTGEDLRYQMASYYSYFASTEHLDQPVVTVPYVDFSQLGHIFSICLPLASDNSNAETVLIGVTCLDMTLRDITNEFEYLQRSSNAYVFIIDSTGRTILHPMLPIPGLDYRSDPLFVDIVYFEPDAHQAGILDQMKALTDGNKTIEATIITNRGFAPLHGVDNERRRTTYIWRAVLGTHFSVAIVLTDRDVELSIETTEAASSFVYHKFCDDIAVCTNKGQEATIEYGTTQLSSRAFKENIIKREDCEFVEDLREYMTDSRRESTKLNEGIRELYSVISEMIPEWRDVMTQYNDVIYERFIASQSGMFTVFPGTTMPDDYDHTNTDWYNMAYSNKDQLVFTPPRANEFGRQNVVTIAHTLLEGTQEAHSIVADSTIGVIGMNVDVSFLEVLLYQQVQQCAHDQYRCMLMDTAGFIIYHPDADAQYKHVAQLEQEIASDLIRRLSTQDKPVINKCDDFAWKLQYNTWHFAIDDGFPADFYQVFPFSRTNLLLIIRDLTAFTTPRTCDSCDVMLYTAHDGTPECNRVDSMTCNCPCHSVLDYDPCENRFDIETPYPTCSKPVFPEHRPVNTVSTAPPCYPVECSTFTTELDCRFRPECDWFPFASRDGISCYRNGSVVPTDSPDTPERRSSDSGESDSSNTGAIVGIVFAILFLLALIGVGIFLFLKFRKRDTPKFMPDNDTHSPGDNPIYDELHYVAPSAYHRMPTKAASTASTELSSVPTAVGVLNPAFRQNSAPAPSTEPVQPVVQPMVQPMVPPVVPEPVQRPTQYNSVLTSQYLTHGNVVAMANNGTPQGESQSPTCVPPSAELQLTPQAMSYHGSYSGNETDNRSNISYSTQRSNHSDRTNSLEPAQSVNESVHSSLGRYIGPNGGLVHNVPVRENYVNEQAIDYSTGLKHTPPKIEDMYIGKPSLPVIHDANHSKNQPGRYLPMDRKSGIENQNTSSPLVRPESYRPDNNIQQPYALEQNPEYHTMNIRPTNERYPSEHFHTPVNQTWARNGYDNQARNEPQNLDRSRTQTYPSTYDPNARNELPNPGRSRPQTYPQGDKQYSLQGHINPSPNPAMFNTHSQHPMSLREDNKFPPRQQTALPPIPPENDRIQFLSAPHSFTRSQTMPGENSDGGSSRGSMFSSYI